MLDRIFGGGKTYDTSIFGSEPILDEATGKPKYPISAVDEILRLFRLGVFDVENPEKYAKGLEEAKKRYKSQIFNRYMKDPKKLGQARKSIVQNSLP